MQDDNMEKYEYFSQLYHTLHGHSTKHCTLSKYWEVGKREPLCTPPSHSPEEVVWCFPESLPPGEEWPGRGYVKGCSLEEVAMEGMGLGVQELVQQSGY